MKLIKKIVLVLAVLMSFCLVACTESNGGKSDLEQVVDALNGNVITYQGTDNLNSVTGNVLLSTSVGSVTLSWTSSNTSVISNTGAVTRTTEDTDVKLTVVATLNDETLSKTFNLVVKGTSSSNPGGNTTPTTVSTISAVQAMAADTEAKVQGTIIGVYAKGFMVYDGTGAILVYLNQVPTNNLGEYVEVSGAISAYKEKMQFTSTCTITKLDKGTDYTLDVKTIKESEVEGASTTLAYAEKVQIVAQIASISTSYVNMNVVGSSVGVALAYYADSSKLTVGGMYVVTGLYMYTSAYNNVTSIYLLTTDIQAYEGYAISFDVEGIDSITAYKDVSVGTLPTPEKFGYTFDGWYDGDTLVTEKTVFTKDTKLTAKFTQITVDEAEQAKVTEVINAIKALGDAAATEEYKAKLEAVEAKYEALTANGKALVSNYDDLVAARKAYNKLNQSNAICATFEFGSNGEATHNDGSSVSEYTETNNGYTLSIKNGEKVYSKAFDAKGNSCLKMGTSSAIGKFDFTVADDVNSVVIRIAAYKAKTVTIVINGQSYNLTNGSDNGEYFEITIDTSTTKTVTVATSTGYRAMINSISFIN